MYLRRMPIDAVVAPDGGMRFRLRCLIFLLAKDSLRRMKVLFFESDGFAHHYHSQVSGNPVRIGDGYATVTGYKLPQPLVPQIGTGKAGARFRPEVRISPWLCSSWSYEVRRQRCRRSRAANFSVKEKDEASPARVCALGSAECLHSPFCRGLKVFYFPTPRWSLNRKPVPRNVFAEQIERSAL